MSGIKARAEVMFFDDPFERPQVVLTGRWSAKEINKVTALLAREYRKHIRAIQRGEKTLEDPLEVNTTLNLEDEEEVSDDEAAR